MIVRVEVSGHQYAAAYKGEVLAWLQGLSGDAQVPCVVLRMGKEILTIPLQHKNGSPQVKVEAIEP